MNSLAIIPLIAAIVFIGPYTVRSFVVMVASFLGMVNFPRKGTVLQFGTDAAVFVLSLAALIAVVYVLLNVIK